MSSEKLYLRSNVVAEPLIDHWYAWAHLIPPATAAMNMVGCHSSLMESYVKSLQVHAAPTPTIRPSPPLPPKG